MRGMFAIAAAVVGFGAIAALAADPNNAEAMTARLSLDA